MPPRPGAGPAAAGRHHGGGWLRHVVLAASFAFACLYLAFFLATSRHALQAATKENDLHHPKGGLIQSLAAQQKQQQQQMKQLEEQLLQKEREQEQLAAAAAPAASAQQADNQQQPPPQATVQQVKEETEEPAAPVQQPPPAKSEPQQPAQEPAAEPAQKPPAKEPPAPAQSGASKHVSAAMGRLTCRRGKDVYNQSDPGSVVFWRTWTEETPVWRSPYAVADEEANAGPKYITFEPDEVITTGDPMGGLIEQSNQPIDQIIQTKISRAGSTTSGWRSRRSSCWRWRRGARWSCPTPTTCTCSVRHVV